MATPFFVSKLTERHVEELSTDVYHSRQTYTIYLYEGWFNYVRFKIIFTSRHNVDTICQLSLCTSEHYNGLGDIDSFA